MICMQEAANAGNIAHGLFVARKQLYKGVTNDGML
jgi:hypothetical protein